MPMDDMDSRINFVNYKPLSLPGTYITGFISMASLAGFLFLSFSALMIQDESLFHDLVPVLSITFAVGYLCYSFRIVISRHKDTLIVHRQFIVPQIQFFRREYTVKTLTADEVKYAGGEDSGPTTYTTLYTEDQVVIKYGGQKEKLRYLLPELFRPKTESSDVDDTIEQPFWSKVSRDS